MRISSRFLLDGLFVVAAAFLTVASMAWSAGPAGWTAFGVSTGIAALGAIFQSKISDEIGRLLPQAPSGFADGVAASGTDAANQAPPQFHDQAFHAAGVEEMSGHRLCAQWKGESDAADSWLASQSLVERAQPAAAAIQPAPAA